jgi:hypothetical protein
LAVTSTTQVQNAVRKMIAEEQGIGHLSNERLRKSLSVLVGFYIAPGLGSVWNAWRGTANVAREVIRDRKRPARWRRWLLSGMFPMMAVDARRSA